MTVSFKSNQPVNNKTYRERTEFNEITFRKEDFSDLQARSLQCGNLLAVYIYQRGVVAKAEIFTHLESRSREIENRSELLNRRIFGAGFLWFLLARPLHNLAKEIERLNVRLAARTAELEATNVELVAFNYSVAHDLRQPLNVISSYCQVMEELCGSNIQISGIIGEINLENSDSR